LATSFQHAVVDVLVDKTIRAAEEYEVKQIILAGGVAANSGLRKALKEAVEEHFENVDLVIPPLSLCGDNAAMIGAAAFIEAENKKELNLKLNAQPGLTL